jgi:cell division protein FtsQ
VAARGLKRSWWVAGSAAGVLGLWLLVPWMLRQADFFRLRRIEVVGVRYLPADAILRAFAAPDSANLFDDWNENRDEILGVAGVRSASVDRRLPGTLRLIITETTPVALSPGSDRMALIDADGVVLPFDPSRSAPDLPVMLAADPGTARLLARIRMVAPGFYGRISTARRVEDDVLLTFNRKRLWLSPGSSSSTIRAVVAVERDLVQRSTPFQEIDGRFADQVVVRQRPT